VLLIVEDPERARAFYEQVLGVEVVRARDRSFSGFTTAGSSARLAANQQPTSPA
jgi:catechol 2,3-dioxygenase-like lactoylglutathione lyase family enzyme